MAKVILGVGTSHGPQLMMPPDTWGLREKADRQNTSHWYRGKRYTFDELVSLRKTEQFTPPTLADHRVRYDACQQAIGRLAQVYAQAKPDVAVIIGNDQFELFTEVNIPAFSIFWGKTLENIPKTAEQRAKLPPGIELADPGYCPPQRTAYSGQPALGRHMIETLLSERFDVAQSTLLPVGPNGNNGAPHAFGYVYRRVMNDIVPPHVPVMVNTHYPPNRPDAARCLEFGRALGRAIASWESSLTVAVIASGGMTHYVIDEDFDRRCLNAMRDGDDATLAAIHESMFQSGGTAEIKNWIPAYGALTELGLQMHPIDYVPCYRSAAGTGNAMGFAYWTPST